jgi:arylsulfatase A-like enzyme
MDSREMHDHILRLDRSLGAFLDSLYKLRDPSRVIVALTADHGMAPYPELHFPGTDPHRGRADVAPVLARARAALAARGVPERALDFESGVVLLDRAALARAGVRADSLTDALVRDLSKVPGVMRVYRRAELAPLAAKGDKYAREWLHMTPDDLPSVAYVTLQPYYYYAPGTSATHGSPHDYDTHVPIIFYGAPFRPGKYASFVRTVDIAPTLAAVLGIMPTEPLDGVVLKQALK